MSAQSDSDRISSSIAARYARLRAEVPEHVTIVAVSKAQPLEAVAAALAAGATDIGENYVQEARRKFKALGGTRFAKHFIGHVQTNKAKAIVESFDVVQSVDRLDAARALAKAARALGKQLPILLQLNISPSERFGVAPADAVAFAAELRREESLMLDGVMAIGPLDASPAETARAFAMAAKTFRQIGGRTLSLGMSDDWREAVEAGSTMIRIGSALFGARPALGGVED